MPRTRCRQSINAKNASSWNHESYSSDELLSLIQNAIIFTAATAAAIGNGNGRLMNFTSTLSRTLATFNKQTSATLNSLL